MSELKRLLKLSLVSKTQANALLEKHHPLGKGLGFSFALGVFWDASLQGVLTWGAPSVNLAVQAYGLRLYDALELRKMWVSDALPANSESRILGVAVRLVRNQYPHLRMLLTYCDSDEAATAYRAAGWVPQQAHTYTSHVTLADGQTLSKQAVSKRGGLKNLQVREAHRVSRRKWVYPLTDRLSQDGLVVTPVSLP